MDCITGTAVLEFDPAETLSPVGAISPAYPRLCRPHPLPWPAHPRGKPRLSTSTRYEEIDLAIRHGAGYWPGLDAVNLCPEELFPVCSPALLRCQGGIRRPVDVLQFPLLHLNDWRDWPKWLEAAGTSGAGPLPGPVLNHASMLIDAAIEGQGVALARTTLAATDLLNDRLARPF